MKRRQMETGTEKGTESTERRANRRDTRKRGQERRKSEERRRRRKKEKGRGDRNCAGRIAIKRGKRGGRKVGLALY